MKERISTIMVKNLSTISPEENLEEARKHFFEDKLHRHLPVVDKDNKLVGILSTTDLLKLNKPFDEYKNIYVKDIMTSKVGTLSPDDQIGAAAEIFLHNVFHTIPVVDEDRKLVGIVSPIDILKHQHDQHYPAFEK